MATNFIFSEAHFNRIFPFYILLNQDLMIESNGSELEQIVPGIKGTHFSEIIQIIQPHLIRPDFETLKSNTHNLLVIEFLKQQQTNLTGQFDYLPESKQLLFIGTPQLSNIQDDSENKLQILLQKVTLQEKALNEAKSKITDAGLFQNQNPDPLIRINFKGDILRKNPSAEQLDFIIFEDSQYTIEELFKLIAKRIDINLEKWEFEGKSKNIDYSFRCIPLKSDGYINIYGRDISQLKKDQLQLDRLYFIIQQTQQSIVITNEKVEIEWINNAFEKNTGFTLSEITGKNPGSILQGKDTNPDTIKFMKRQIRKSRSFTCEIYNYKKSGEGFWGRLSVQPIFDSKGNIVQFFSILEDITKEIETKGQRQEAINRMSSLITNLQAGILLVNENRKIELINPRFCEIFNINEKLSNLIGGESSRTINLAKQYFKNVSSFESDIEIRKKERKLVTGEILEMQDGRIFERDFIPIWNGEIYNGNLWVYNEITEKLNFDKKLEAQKEFYEEVLDNIPADIAVFDNEHHYLYVNPKGISDPVLRKWLIGKKDEDYVRYRNKPLSIIKERRKLFDEVMKTKALKSWEEELKQTDGSSNYILRHMYPVLNNSDQVKLIIGYGVDITYSKNVLLQKEESEGKYKDVVENSLALITTHDLEGKLLSANPIVGKTYGYNNEEFIGHSISEFMPKEDSHLFFENYLINIKKEKKLSGIFRVISKNGEIIYTLYNNFLKEEIDKAPYVIGFAVDITDRIKAEAELKKAQKITEEVAQSKQKFLAHMSHEIRTPMNAIMGMTNQLSKSLLNKEQHNYINIIKNASSNLLNIINEILDLSKIEAGKLSLEVIGFEPKLVIGQVMQVMMHKAEEKGLLFTNSHCDIKLADVLLGDPYRLNQILLNLVSNSIKFTDAGTVDISCNVIEENDLQQIVKVTVSDTGKGMDEAFTKKLFKKYTQEDESTARIYGGTGLGMSICEELVHLMDGSISVESKKGGGTSISFVIPFSKGTKDLIQVKEIVQLDTNLLKGTRVLIADDYEINRLVASTILNNFDVITDEAKNGIEAIEKVEAGHYDLILMDVQMPEMDGLEATHYIRNKISKTIPIIALTAYALKGDDAKFISAGMDDYLSKPFEENQLLEIMLKWIKKTEIKLPKEIILPKSTPLFDLTKIQTIARGNKEFVTKMIELFIETTPVSIIDMKTAYSNKDFDKVKKIAHRIKPAIDNLEISGIKNDVREIEMNAETYQTSEQLEILISKVEQVINEVVTNLKLLV
jgi:PAS domain S-box-containing protein